jgi:hypothetical protein
VDEVVTHQIGWLSELRRSTQKKLEEVMVEYWGSQWTERDGRCTTAARMCMTGSVMPTFSEAASDA